MTLCSSDHFGYGFKQDLVTCDQASLFFRDGKEHLIQLHVLDYSSALCQRDLSVMPSYKNEPIRITRSFFVGGNYTRHKEREVACTLLYSTAEQNMVYFD